eukprot:scaffold121_cov356-Pavlova_lutheri.AAC.1
MGFGGGDNERGKPKVEPHGGWRLAALRPPRHNVRQQCRCRGESPPYMCNRSDISSHCNPSIP